MAEENLFFIEKQIALESARFAKAKPTQDRKQAQMQTDAALVQLQRIDHLREASNLYAGITELQGASPAIVRDYLARQRSRFQVLASYAEPYVRFLKNQPTLASEQKQTLIYWENTLAALTTYMHSADHPNQMSLLEQAFAELASLALDDLAIILRRKATPELPPYGNDWFSWRRKKLEDLTLMHAQSRAQGNLNAEFSRLASRFNAELAGRYPFGAADTADVDPAAAKSVLQDYGSGHEALHRLLDVDVQKSKHRHVYQFVESLDRVATFFQDSLCCAESSQPFHVAVNFQVLPQFTQGHDQVVSMRMSSGFQRADFPNGNTTLAWRPGDPVSFEIDFAYFSDWRPVADPSNPALVVEGTRVTYAAKGDWALLRLIDKMRPKKGPGTDPLNPYMAYLEMAVPLVSTTNPDANATSHARIYVGITLSSVTPDTQVLKPRKLPSFPRSAPQLNGGN